jgi:hypothetical protein
MDTPCRGRTVDFDAEGLSAVAVAMWISIPFILLRWASI